MKRFSRRIEDFVCGHCGTPVKGDGYTNHCPSCLYSRHVDINPGDRAADCGGLMEVAGFERKGEDYVVTHRCRECGFTRNNRLAPDDNIEVLHELSRARVKSGP